MNNLEIPMPEKQISFFYQLVELRKGIMLDALLEQVTQIEVPQIDLELSQYVKSKRLGHMAKFGLRGEIAFPLPIILESKPMLLGYYRLLLGFSKKEFYDQLGFGRFKVMEESNRIPEKIKSEIPMLCKTLIESSWVLVKEMPGLSLDIVNELTLLTIGPMLRGSDNVTRGNTASKLVFKIIRDIVKDSLVDETESSILCRNTSKRNVTIAFSADPDIVIFETMKSGAEKKVLAVEIKGGLDISNIHNRLGEAEKSHQKAKGEGFTECWTIVGTKNLDEKLAKKESPATDRFFYIGNLGKEFAELLRTLIGIED